MTPGPAAAATPATPGANPLREGSLTLRAPDPCTFVVFGATGDLTHRKLVPALFALAREKALHPKSALVGFSRRPWDDQAFRDAVRPEGSPDENGEWSRFAASLSYRAGSFENPGDYAALRGHLEALERERGTPGNRVFYLATPPDAYPVILEGLRGAGLVHPSGEPSRWSRVIVEKPFGHDLVSARALNEQVHASFDERQVFRIDHYLGKETVQNILVLRLGNGIFEPLWNNRYVDHVQISVAEAVGVEGRANYFERAGVARDMLQNHMLQLLTLTAMEPPSRFEADAVRDEKAKVLRALAPLRPEQVSERTVRGRYEAGAVAGAAVPGYLQEPDVNPRSRTETYLAAKLEVDNWRWAGVPFYVRSGKRLAKRATEIVIVFRHPPYALFRSAGCESLEANVLRLRIQPDEGISLSFGSKSPGQDLHIDPVRMDFNYLTSFGADPPDAYQRLLLDCNLGDSTLFARRDEVELAWEHVDAIAAGWESGEPPLHGYAAGSWGPAEADHLLARDGRRWYRL
ncbi:MAG TPA: glucose-6-phosphate dehydrogenase [Candidatus Eisenbacteria bacterium]|nr:glucose-6-phosphate dehydrogenase [Candidatus Eisenbacteria bacterium]